DQRRDAQLCRRPGGASRDAGRGRQPRAVHPGKVTVHRNWPAAGCGRGKIPAMAILEVQHLRKSFGPLVAVDDVSFTLESGRLVGLLGPNGAGKTTTVSMISALVTPERGQVLVGGQKLSGDTDPAKRRIGLVPQDLALYDELTAGDNLRFFGALYN